MTTADDKQSQLQKEILDIKNRLLHLSRAWVVDPDANVDREKRIRVGQRVVEWLQQNELAVYYRVHALQESLAIHEGDELELSDCTEISSKRHGDPLPRHLRSFLHDWATQSVGKRWEQYTASHEDGGPWLDPNNVNALARYMSDYLLREEVFEDLLKRLGPVVNLKTRDEAARRRARRKYVRIIMNDFLMNPGPSMVPIKNPQKGEQPPGATGSASADSGEQAPEHQAFRADGLVRPPLDAAAAPGPGLGGRRARADPARQRGIDHHAGTVRAALNLAQHAMVDWPVWSGLAWQGLGVLDELARADYGRPYGLSWKDVYQRHPSYGLGGPGQPGGR